jgi:hypothetical protein
VNIGSAFFQNEWKNEKWSILLGERLDKHNLIDNPIFSPRVNLLYKPVEPLAIPLLISKLGSTDVFLQHTATDLLVYLIKYRGWLLRHRATENEWVRAELAKLDKNPLNLLRYSERASIEAIREMFDKLLGCGDEIDGEKMRLVVVMVAESWLLVKYLWEEREADNAELKKALWKGQGATS